MNILQVFLDYASALVLPAILVGFPLYGMIRKVRVYEVFVEGAKEGFNVAVMIIPYVIAILFAIGMFRASGAMDFLTDLLRPVVGLIGIPAEVIPMGIVRPSHRIRVGRNYPRHDQPVWRRFNLRQNGCNHVWLDRNHVLCDCRLLRCCQYPQDTPCCTCGTNRRHLCNAGGRLRGPATLRLECQDAVFREVRIGYVLIGLGLVVPCVPVNEVAELHF